MHPVNFFLYDLVYDLDVKTIFTHVNIVANSRHFLHNLSHFVRVKLENFIQISSAAIRLNIFRNLFIHI